MSKKRFIGRLEYFGSLLFDSERKEYIPFDQDATSILFNISNFKDIDEIYYRYFSAKFNYLNYKSFIQLAQYLDIIKEDYTLNVDFLINENIELLSEYKILSAPLKVYFALTYSCPLRCKHCFSNSGDIEGSLINQELSIDRIKSILKELKELGVYYISFGGGDPFDKNNFIQILKYANDLDLVIFISTPLVNFDKYYQEIINNNIKIKEFKVSVDAVSSRDYMNIKGKSYFDKLKNNLKLLQNYKEINKELTIRLHFVLNKLNYNDLPAFLNFAEQYQADKLSFSPIFITGRATKDLALSQEILKKIDNIINTMKERTKIEIEFFNVPLEVGKTGLYTGFGCGCGKTVCYISPYGDVLPSGMFINYKELFSYGNLKNSSFKDIWLNTHLKEINNITDYDNRCKECEYFDNCRGGCRFRSFNEFKSLIYKDPTCYIKN